MNITLLSLSIRVIIKLHNLKPLIWDWILNIMLCLKNVGFSIEDVAMQEAVEEEEAVNGLPIQNEDRVAYNKDLVVQYIN